MPDTLKIDCNVEIPLRDGVKLRADVYRPDDASKHPVILARLPYNKDLSLISLSLLSPIRAAKRGYVVVIQDTRGRFKSDGQFSLFALNLFLKGVWIQWFFVHTSLNIY